jgi:hypothetical protein
VDKSVGQVVRIAADALLQDGFTRLAADLGDPRRFRQDIDIIDKSCAAPMTGMGQDRIFA